MTVRVRVKLPKIGMTMEEATIVRFCRQPGEAFRKGDPSSDVKLTWGADPDGVASPKAR